jgi:hypothetical protein
MYVHERLSPAEIGQSCGVAEKTVKRWLREGNIRRSRFAWADSVSLTSP